MCIGRAAVYGSYYNTETLLEQKLEQRKRRGYNPTLGELDVNINFLPERFEKCTLCSLSVWQPAAARRVPPPLGLAGDREVLICLG